MSKTKRISIDFRKYAMFIALIAISLIFQILTKGVLLAPRNVSKLIMQNSYILILAIGMLPCILTGDIDLSVGSIVALVGAAVGTAIINNKVGVVPAIIMGLILGILIGAWQGFWIAYVGVPAFIVTLAGMLIFRGFTLVILGGKTLSPYPKSFQNIAQAVIPDIPGLEASHISTLLVGLIVAIVAVVSIIGSFRKNPDPHKSTASLIAKTVGAAFVILLGFWWLARFDGLPVILILLGVLVLVYTFVTQRTVLGRHVYALGGNAKAAQLSGIKTKQVKFLVYTNMGLLSAIAGIVFSSRLNAAGPTAGNGFELDAIASCYIGGASAGGGIGTIPGAIIGGLVMGVLNNGMSIMGIGDDWQQVVKGFILLLAVAFDIISQKRKA